MERHFTLSILAVSMIAILTGCTLFSSADQRARSRLNELGFNICASALVENRGNPSLIDMTDSEVRVNVSASDRCVQQLYDAILLNYGVNCEISEVCNFSTDNPWYFHIKRNNNNNLEIYVIMT